ncbi:adenine deaminase [Sulfobacillus acidophilus TPY]|uniref:Adenine deaminase n=1 Tax=Sulfobacillus acidophilus (strain ATCC 700253 / DSM 10332 / NAL) TaxID=679936 RepID=G8TU96_SULAD|nr:adenine deaminase [Sulfobacillus acidophilus TPY]AEW05768.1 Adenine deaminase [Sulfobacillus acidophilus DSM 10332]
MLEYTPDVRARLSQVALGHMPADLVISHATLVNVHTGELEFDISVAIHSGHIAYVGREPAVGANTQMVDARGQYLIPGLMDGHMHIESSMLSVTEFARAVLPHGTTTVFMDPHEMANVFGLPGIQAMLQEAENVPLRVFTTMPSCVPAAPGMEGPGIVLGPQDVEMGLGLPRVVGLSEVMDFPGVLRGDPSVLEKIRATWDRRLVATGHLPTADPRVIQAYAATGIYSDHESTTRAEALEKARRGIMVMIREGTAWKDVAECIKIITEDGVDPHQCMLVTDDVEPSTLIHEGHLNHVVRRAIQEGVDPVAAIQMATINTARYFHLEDLLGSVAPGKVADLCLIPDLRTMRPSLVLVQGRIVAENGMLTIDLPPTAYPPAFTASIRVNHPITPDDLLIHADPGVKGPVWVRAVSVSNNSVMTRLENVPAVVERGLIQRPDGADWAYAAVIDRHHASGAIGQGLVRGFGLTQGAVASSVAHDSHQLIVMGADFHDMAYAANVLIEAGGGLVAVLNQEVLAIVRLPIAGLLSTESASSVAHELDALKQAWRRLGSSLNAPYMTFSLIALPVIPEVRITTYGLVDVIKASILPLTV